MALTEPVDGAIAPTEAARLDPLSDVLRTVKLTGALFFLVEALVALGRRGAGGAGLRSHSAAERAAGRLVSRRPRRRRLGRDNRAVRRPGSRPATSCCSPTAIPTRCSARRASRRSSTRAPPSPSSGRWRPAGCPSSFRKAAADPTERGSSAAISLRPAAVQSAARHPAAPAAAGGGGEAAGRSAGPAGRPDPGPGATA